VCRGGVNVGHTFQKATVSFSRTVDGDRGKRCDSQGDLPNALAKLDTSKSEGGRWKKGAPSAIVQSKGEERVC